MSRAGKGGGKGSSSKTTKPASGRWLWRAPLRALAQARDLYVRSCLNGCAGLLPPDAAAGFGCSRRRHHDDDGFSSSSSSFSRSFSASSSFSSSAYGDGDLRELIRAASERRAADRPAAAVARSRSVAMARIDEDRPCEFAGSRSCAERRRGQA